MTQTEISKYLDIPFATLNDWKQENSNRNKLYELLSNLEIDFVEKILNKDNEDILKQFSKRDEFWYHKKQK